MKNRKKSLFVATTVMLMSSAALGNDKGVDRSNLVADGIAKDAAILVHAFDASGADLGKFKHRDTAERAAETAPHLLAVDIVETLREHGFKNITLSDATQPAGDALQLIGTFTEINPGSQSSRVWIGFGAGASKVCVKGSLQTAAGDVVGTFKDCQKGIGWGNSSDQTSGESSRIGANIGNLLNSWAK